MSAKSDTELADAFRASPNVEPRRNGCKPSILLLHYTGVETAAKAVDWLTRSESKVSCHYAIDEAGRITQMVAEEMRAWHAGEAMWAGECDINSASIGVEVHNPGHEMGYPDFPEAQLRPWRRFATTSSPGTASAPSACLPTRMWRRPARRTPARSSPGRGWRGPASAIGWRPSRWSLLSRAWVSASPARWWRTCRLLLAKYGYGIEPTGVIDSRTEFVITAFQRHFRPERVDGRIDQSTITTLERLIAALPKDAWAREAEGQHGVRCMETRRSGHPFSPWGEGAACRSSGTKPDEGAFSCAA